MSNGTRPPSHPSPTPDQVSPLPWHVRFETNAFYVMTGRDYYVARCHLSPGDLDDQGNEQFSDKANVRYIVRACNSYPALVSALRTLIEQVEAAIPAMNSSILMAHVHGMSYNGPQIDISAAREAVKLAEADHAS